VETLSDFRYGGNQKLLVTLLQLAFIFIGEALVDGAAFPSQNKALLKANINPV
jgi:hypothetical protein